MSTLDFHFVNRLRLQAKNFANRTALCFQEQENGAICNGLPFNKRSIISHLHLIAQGIEIQDKIGIFAHNMPRWSIADFGAMPSTRCDRANLCHQYAFSS